MLRPVNIYIYGVTFEKLVAFYYFDEEFKQFKADLSKFIKTVLKQCPHLTEKQLLDNMGFPTNWTKINRYKYHNLTSKK